MCSMFFGLEQEVETDKKCKEQHNQMQDRWKQKTKIPQTAAEMFSFVSAEQIYFVPVSLKRHQVDPLLPFQCHFLFANRRTRVCGF